MHHVLHVRHQVLVAVALQIYRGQMRQPACDIHRSEARTVLASIDGQADLRFQFANLRGGKRLETGDILFHKNAKRWAAVAGEFGQAYDSGLVKSCVRQLLFVRPGTVVVVDRIAAPAGKKLPEVSWLLHVPGRPAVGAAAATATNGKAWLRCQPLLPGGVKPEVKPGQKTQLSPAHKLSDTSRLAFTYKGKEKLTLVHVLEVGDGKTAAKPVKVRAESGAGGIEISLDGKTFLFSGKAPFPVSRK